MPSPRAEASAERVPRLTFPPLASRCAASAAFHTPNPRTGRALSHPASRLERTIAQLTARGGPLAPPTLDSLVERIDRLLAQPFAKPRSLLSPEERAAGREA